MLRVEHEERLGKESRHVFTINIYSRFGKEKVAELFNKTKAPNLALTVWDVVRHGEKWILESSDQFE